MTISSFLNEHSACVCDRYAKSVGKASSKAALARLLDVNVCEWLCMMEPVHKASEWLLAYFRNHLNGRFVKHCDGYTCSVWCGFTGEIALDTDVTALVGCKAVTVVVPDNAVMRVFASGGVVEARLGKRASLHIDATEDTMVVAVDERVKVKYIKHYGQADIQDNG